MTPTPPHPSGFHKILKKHDKMLPHSPCRQFYISHLHNQPWVQVGAAPPRCPPGLLGVHNQPWVQVRACALCITLPFIRSLLLSTTTRSVGC